MGLLCVILKFFVNCSVLPMVLGYSFCLGSFPYDVNPYPFLRIWEFRPAIVNISVCLNFSAFFKYLGKK